MRRVGELMWQAVQEFYRVAAEWVAGLPVELDPRLWSLQVWLIAAGALLVLLLLVRRPRRGPRRGNWPELMISHGEIVLQGAGPVAAPADGGRRRAALLVAPEGAAYQLRMTVSNLNAYPMQLLELAVRVSGLRQPVVADASAVVPPHGAVDVVADLAELPGDSGSFELYLFGTRARPRTVRLTVPLEWEPWNQRYRLRATGQRVDRAGALPSVGLLQSERARRRAARLAVGARQVADAVAGGAERVGTGVRVGWARLQAAREARAAARAARARAVDSAAMRPVPTSVPFGPGARSEARQMVGAGSGAGAMVPNRPFGPTAVGASDDPRLPLDTRPFGGARAPGEPAPDADEEQQAPVRPRLDFPDEF